MKKVLDLNRFKEHTVRITGILDRLESGECIPRVSLEIKGIKSIYLKKFTRLKIYKEFMKTVKRTYSGKVNETFLSGMTNGQTSVENDTTRFNKIQSHDDISNRVINTDKIYRLVYKTI